MGTLFNIISLLDSGSQ